MGKNKFSITIIDDDKFFNNSRLEFDDSRKWKAFLCGTRYVSRIYLNMEMSVGSNYQKFSSHWKIRCFGNSRLNV